MASLIFGVETFSLLAIGTSLIGTLLGFSEFFKEQLNNFSWKASSIESPSEHQPGKELFGLKNWWGRNKISFTATAMVVAPTLFVSTTVPDAFSAATDIALCDNLSRFKNPGRLLYDDAVWSSAASNGVGSDFSSLQ
ncbi:hypothetical protein ACOSQ2_014343 [Xanthoceras sorbifolium]